MRSYRVGVDLGGTGIKVGVVSDAGEIVGKAAARTDADRPWKLVAEDIRSTATGLLERLGMPLRECRGVGAGSPGLIDHLSGTVRFAGNLGWEEVPLAAELERLFGLPSRIANDANCAVLAEAVAGAAKGYGHVVMLTLGTGVGSGVIVEGRLEEGGSAGGMELGHTLLAMDGEACTCGRRGCFEAYASATALIRMAKRACLEHPESGMLALCGGDAEAMDGRVPFLAAAEGDCAAQGVVRGYIRSLGEGIINCVNIWRPEIVVLGGGIANEGPGLFTPLREYVEGRCFGGDRVAAPPVVRAALGNDAGILGAANLIS